jgi:hypothetical protein
MDTFPLSDAARSTAGILLLTLLAVEAGGLYLLGVIRGAVPRTPFQRAFERAGHAHAGVLVTLSLIVQVLADATALAQPWAQVARSGIPLAAILMPAGFFLSAAGPARERPRRALFLLIPAGGVALGAGAAALGLGLLFVPA